MSQPRPFQGNPGLYNDTKLFVGGLAWETQRDTMRRYFEQFGEILEAVVITDKNTARSKGYGFVTFKDPEAAMRACQNPSPVIDGRRANCNLASIGAHKPRPPNPLHGGRFRAPPGLSSYHGSSSTLFHPPGSQYTFPYSAYGYTGYSQDNMYPNNPMNYYGVYGGQQFPPYYTGASGMYHNFYPVYAQGSQAQGFGVQYPQVAHYPYAPQQYGPASITAMPSAGIAGASVTEGVSGTRAAPSASGTGSEQKSST